MNSLLGCFPVGVLLHRNRHRGFLNETCWFAAKTANPAQFESPYAKIRNLRKTNGALPWRHLAGLVSSIQTVNFEQFLESERLPLPILAALFLMVTGISDTKVFGRHSRPLWWEEGCGASSKQPNRWQQTKVGVYQRIFVGFLFVLRGNNRHSAGR